MGTMFNCNRRKNATNGEKKKKKALPNKGYIHDYYL